MAIEPDIEVHAVHWRGVDIEITYDAVWLGMGLRAKVGLHGSVAKWIVWK